FLFGLQSNLARAKKLGKYELYWGNAKLITDELEHYLSVTRKDIQRVAKRYFKPSNRTVLNVKPVDSRSDGAAKPNPSASDAPEASFFEPAPTHLAGVAEGGLR